MPKCNKSNFNHVLYNLNRARAKSGSKIENIMNHYNLLKRKETDGSQTQAWLKQAWIKLHAKMHKHRITEDMIASYNANKA